MRTPAMHMATWCMIMASTTINTMITALTSTITAVAMPMTTSKPADPGMQCASLRSEGASVLYRLMTWLSPAFPVGAFSYSSGIEWAVEAGDIVDAATLQDWLSAMLSDGAGFCDGVFVAHVHRAASAGHHVALGEIAELASAF